MMNVIIISNSHKDLIRLVKKHTQDTTSFKLYSDNPSLHDEVTKISNRYNVSIDANYYTNYDNIEKIWDEYYIYSEKINDWSKNIHKHLNFPSSIFFWGLNNEGWNSSVIFNSLLTSYLMRNLIKGAGKKIVYIRNDTLEYKDTELILDFLCKDRKNITFKILGPIFPFYSKILYIYSRAILSILKMLIYTFIKKLVSIRPKSKSFDNYCVIHYLGASYQRIEGELAYFEKIEEKKIPILVLTEHCSLFPLKYNHENIKIERLESWLKFSMFWKVFKLSFQSIKLILSKSYQISGLINEKEISSILKHYLIISSINYSTRNLMSHLLLSEFIKHNKISMFRVPALSNVGGVVDIDVIKKNKGIKIFTGLLKHSSLRAFHGSQNFDISMAVKSDALVFINLDSKNDFLSKGVKEENIEIYHSEILNSLSKPKAKISIAEPILKKLKSKKYRIKILLDATDPGSPHRSPQEHFDYMNVFLQLAKENLEILLIVKPHSGNKREISEFMVKNTIQSNIILLDKKLAGSFFFKYADLFCSRSSTMMYDAAGAKIPCLGVKLEGLIYDDLIEKKFKFVYSVEELKSIINSLVNNKKFCTDWLSNTIAVQNNKLKVNKIDESNEFFNTEELMIEALKSRYREQV
jgi:hypothetical protein